MRNDNLFGLLTAAVIMVILLAVPAAAQPILGFDPVAFGLAPVAKMVEIPPPIMPGRVML